MSAGAKWLEWLVVAAVVTGGSLLFLPLGLPVFMAFLVAGSVYSAPRFVRALTATFPDHFPGKFRRHSLAVWRRLSACWTNLGGLIPMTKAAIDTASGREDSVPAAGMRQRRVKVRSGVVPSLNLIVGVAVLAVLGLAFGVSYWTHLVGKRPLLVGTLAYTVVAFGVVMLARCRRAPRGDGGRT